MKKILKLKWIILLLIILIAIVLGAILVNKDNNKENYIIDKINTLKQNNPATAAELVKENIVKITNKTEEFEIIGTGFFHESGFLVTNSHIVDIKGNIEIEYHDGTKTNAELISNDINTDIALLSVENPKALAMSFGNTLELNITDEVIALGFSYGLDGEASVTKGILSARRSAGGVEFLQSDISLNSGASGGPLINSKGELLGINTYASENSTIGMSISAENLELILNKLINNKKVKYVEAERPENVLSSVLKEIGYKIEDLYGDKKYLKKEEKTEIKDLETTNKSEIKEEIKVLSNIKTLDSLSIEGYNISFNQNKYYYGIILKNNETSLNISAKTTDPKATYSIIGNNDLKQGENNIEILVKAEDGSIQKYLITASNPITKLDRATGISSGVNIEYNQEINDYCFKLNWSYIDNYGSTVYPTGNTDLFSEIVVDVYAGWSEHDTMIDTNGKELKLLKSYTFYPTSLNQTTVFFKVSEIKNLLTDENYEGGVYNGADLTFKVKLVTKKQGEFKSRCPYGLSK